MTKGFRGVPPRLKSSRLTVEEQTFLLEAAEYFDNPGAFIRGMNFFGSKVDKAQKLLPEKAQRLVTKAVNISIHKALEVSLKTVDKSTKSGSLTSALASSLWRGRAHALATGVTGGVGGFFGLEAIAIELPISTAIMLRSIADTAREFGEDLGKPEGALECLLVLTLGGPGAKDDMTDNAYYGVRLSLAASLQQAAQYIGTAQIKNVLHALQKGTAPALVSLITHVAAAFEVRVTKKLIVQATPIVGGIGGAAINTAFSEFYNRAARYHFGIRKLERQYGADPIRALFLEATKEARTYRAKSERT